MRNFLPKKIPNLKFAFIPVSILCVILAIVVFVLFINFIQKSEKLSLQQGENSKTLSQLKKLREEFTTLKSIDQIKRNDELEKTVKEIQKTYTNAISVYETIIDLPSTSKELPKFRKQFAQVLKYLSDKNYASGSSTLLTLKSEVEKEKTTLSAVVSGAPDVSNLTVNNTAPGSGYSRQRVDAAGSSFLVDIVAGNLSNTRVIVDTASDSDCKNDCPTLPLGSYVSRNGAFAGINGSYFCPADYPTCSGKTNSFDTLAMNKNKHYFNSENNVYSTVPAVIFGGGWVRFVGRSLDWGRDTGVDGVLANQPLLLSGGNITFGGDGDPKKGSRGNRSFVASKGSTVYIGVVRSATVAEVAHILKSMGMDNALNLDSGGSTALWASGGYKAGPGRGIPNAILFVNK